MKVVFLEIRTWTGICPGFAEHFYGAVAVDYKTRHELMHKLSSSEAQAMNRKERGNGCSYRYRKGTESYSFWNEADIIEVAKKVYKKHFPDAEVLLKAPHSTCDPVPVLDGPPEFMELGNAIVAKAEAIDYWENDATSMAVLANEWDALRKRFGV